MASLYDRRFTLSLAVLATGTVLAGCSSATTSSSGPATTPAASSAASLATGSPTPGGVPSTIPEGMGSGTADGEFPRTVKHFQGETTIATAPQKVVIISTGQLDAVLTLGLVPVGATSGDGADLVPAYLTTAFPDHADQLASIASVGSRTEPTVEAIANLAPDLILVNIAGKDAQTLFAALSEVAPTVATQGTGQYWKQDFLLLADALGKFDEASGWLDAFHTDAKAAGENIDDVITVSLLRKNGERTRIFGAVSFAGSVLADMGVARPETQTFTDDTSVDLSEEQLDQADADWIFYGVQGGEATELTGKPLWPALTAVSNNQAVEVDDDPFYLNAGPTAARVVLDTVKATMS